MTTRENDITESFSGDRMSILNEIAAHTKERIAEEKFKVPLRELISQQNSNLAKHAEEKISFLEALKKPGMSYICEVKKASPSKGLIAPDFPYLDIAKEYEQAGASAISCLTEPFYFQGADRYLQEISQAVNIPVLRKDFTVDEYMIYQAKAFGASAVLLICAILDNSQLKAFGELAQDLGLDALNWLLEQGIPFDRINAHEPQNLARYGDDPRKIYAHCYIDDKQVGGLPTWPEIYEYITNEEKKWKENLNKV